VSINFTAAIKEILIRPETDAGVPLGFDLDGVCTCPGPPSCVSSQKQCDGPGGRDGTGDSLFSLLDTFFARTTEGNFNQRIADGRVGLLIWVSGYNGGKDDPSVFASVLLSSGIIDDADAGTYKKPKWDGQDIWNIDPLLAAGYTIDANGDYVWTPKAISTTAYVTHGTLVARIPTAALGYGSGSLAIHDLVLMGDVTPTSFGYRVDAQLGGRIPTREALTLVSTMSDPTNPGQRLCGDDPTYQTFRTSVCTLADLTSDPARDSTGAACDAVSVIFGLTAYSAKTGAPHAAPVSSPGCDGGIRDCP
jgi:hypothetical protein